MNLTIAYITSRRKAQIQWFFDSLMRQCKDFAGINIVLVDRYAGERDDEPYTLPDCKIDWVKPKPCVWQGEHRLTKDEWFAAANARNTALCLAPEGYLVYVDDLSVLLPGWLERVREAMKTGCVVCGTYAKVRNLVVENGFPISYDDYPQGHDSRERFAPTDLHPCEGGWLFGCSCAMPVEALLTIGGWTEFADALSSEDYLTGLTLQNAGFKFLYDKKMKTLESEEMHHLEPPMRRTDKGKSPDDKSHRALNIVLSGQRYFDNYYGGAGIRDERDRVLRGEPFTIRGIPEADWFDGTLLKDMV